MKQENRGIYSTETTAPKTGNSRKLTFEEFVELVKEMRHQQRRYSALRRPEILASAQELEEEVDEEVARLTDSQLSLF